MDDRTLADIQFFGLELYGAGHDVSGEKRDESGEWTDEDVNSDANRRYAERPSKRKFKEIGLPNVLSTAHVTEDPHSYNASIEIDYYGDKKRFTGSGDTREIAVQQAIAEVKGAGFWRDDSAPKKAAGNHGDKPSSDKIADNAISAGLDGFKGVLPSVQQKQVFGRPLFGKKWIKIDCEKRVVTGSFKVAFGQDFNTFEFSFEKIADLVRTGAAPAF